MEIIDGSPPLGQKTVMSCHTPEYFNVENMFARFFSRAGKTLLSLMLGVTLLTTLAAFRHPMTSPIDPLAGLEIQRQLLAGSDALLERGVIPPNRPDWIMMDCSHHAASTTTYDRLRQAICEVSGKSSSTQSAAL